MPKVGLFDELKRQMADCEHKQTENHRLQHKLDSLKDYEEHLLKELQGAYMGSSDVLPPEAR